MTEGDSAYAGRSVVFATMHGKEALARGAFAEHLGARVIAPEHLDTDQLGTFAGDIPRTLTPSAAATAKARLGLRATGLHLALASEASFYSTLFGVETTEILVFLDAERGLEIVECATGDAELPAPREVETLDEALGYAAMAGFPHQGLLLQSHRGADVSTHKTIETKDILAELVAQELERGMTLVVLSDHRAHRSPVRSQRIRSLCDRMARRLATACPTCAAPGYGRVDVLRGLPCELCGSPTPEIAADIFGCGACGEQEPRRRKAQSSDPSRCERCNP